MDDYVLIIGDTLKLIDYDGMFVPALAGRTSNEGGHRISSRSFNARRNFGRIDFAEFVESTNIQRMAA